MSNLKHNSSQQFIIVINHIFVSNYLSGFLIL